ncbi:hypothetical protein [Micromonospora chaiyaphumensis]|uniref:hypothetical protein n=1 Tax=Micromonospora chaiyaphumensis TaxID=307119 RepID=UPI003CC5DB6E
MLVELLADPAGPAVRLLRCRRGSCSLPWRWPPGGRRLRRPAPGPPPSRTSQTSTSRPRSSSRLHPTDHQARNAPVGRDGPASSAMIDR